MATALKLPDDDDKGKAYRRRVRDLWLTWKNSGKEPTFEEATTYLKSQFPKAEHGFNKANSRLSDGLSFLFWDVTENNGEALDYNAEGRQLTDLMGQAEEFIAIGAYKEIASARVYIPDGVSTSERGLQLVGALTAEERKRYLAQMTFDIVKMALRGHDISGMRLRDVVTAIYAALKRIRKEWKKK